VRSNQRLKKLERKARGGGPPCPECGDAEGEPTYELLFDDDVEEYPDHNVYCGTCGDPTYVVVAFPEDTPADSSNHRSRDGGY
jgi:hypothetical protein